MSEGLLFPLPPRDDDFTEDERTKIRDFLTYDNRHGSEVMSIFDGLTKLAMKRGWPGSLGADTLRGWARGTVRDFTLHNDFAPFYVAALSAHYGPRVTLLECEAELPKRLLASGWKPVWEAAADE
jgi:hypothetical protein